MTRGILRLGTATVQVFITQHTDGVSIGTAIVELHDASHAQLGQSPPYLRVKCPNPKEAWAALAVLIGQTIEAVPS